jgi:DNA-directed RNA polymerase specialized sigma24 family protein
MAKPSVPNDPPPSSLDAAIPARVAFETTPWSTVLAAGVDSSAPAHAALARLCRAYWYPLYAYVRRQGANPADAEDITQSFFAHLLQSRIIRRADRSRGTFRTFLLTSLKHFQINNWRRAQAQKRGGQTQVISIHDEGAEERYQLEPVTDLTPDVLFDRRWAITVLAAALEQVRLDHLEAGLEQRFAVLKEFLTETVSDRGYDRAAAALSLTPNAVKVAVLRLRRQYRDAIRDQIAQTVTTSVELEEEMQQLFAALNR